MLLVNGEAWQGQSLNAKRRRTLLFHFHSALKLIEEHAKARVPSGAAKARPETIAELLCHHTRQSKSRRNR